MDWERKFYDIVWETEHNLADARRKLHSHDTTKNFSPRSGTKSPNPAHKHQAYNYKPSAWMVYVNNNHHINSIRQQLGTMGQPTTTTPTTSTQQRACTSTITPCTSEDSIELKSLQGRLDFQAQMIDNLQEFVRSLSREKKEYQQQIKGLQSELDTLRQRVPQAGEMYTQVEQVRREVKADLTQLHNDLSSSKRHNEHHTACLERSIQDTQRSTHRELQDLQRDLNSIASRVSKLEMNMAVRGPGSPVKRRSSPSAMSIQRVSSSVAVVNAGKPMPMVATQEHPSYSLTPVTPWEGYKVKETRSSAAILSDKLEKLEDCPASKKTSFIQPSTKSDPVPRTTSERTLEKPRFSVSIHGEHQLQFSDEELEALELPWLDDDDDFNPEDPRQLSRLSPDIAAFYGNNDLSDVLPEDKENTAGQKDWMHPRPSRVSTTRHSKVSTTSGAGSGSHKLSLKRSVTASTDTSDLPVAFDKSSSASPAGPGKVSPDAWKKKVLDVVELEEDKLMDDMKLDLDSVAEFDHCDLDSLDGLSDKLDDL